MDSLTQIVLGAAVGEATLGKKVGHKAAVWGAIAGTIPDLDVLANFFLNDFQALIAHRGVTHSILFSLVFAPILGWLIFKYHKGKGATQRDWTRLAFWTLLTHPLLDCFTTWGTQLFYPFSDYRVAFNSVFVVDPMYTLPFLIFLIIALTRRRDSSWRRFWNVLGLGLSSFYLVLTLVNKFAVEAVFSNALHYAGKSVSHIEAYPTPFNNVLWYVVAEEPSGFDIGYYSLFTPFDASVQFRYLPKQHELIQEAEEQRVIERLRWVSKDQFVITQSDSSLFWNDLRFGLLNGMTSAETAPEFAFRYKLIQEDSTYVDIEQIQGGGGDDPFGKMRREVLPQLWRGIWGNTQAPPN